MGPWDLSAGGTLDLVVDGGKDVVRVRDGGEDYIVPAAMEVDLADGTFVDPGAATGAEIVTWLNANPQVKARLDALAQRVASLSSQMPAVSPSAKR